jgi:general secretion pathway protein B
MSYILDALRKSDQQRQRGAPPLTLTAPAAEAAPKRASISLNGLLAVVLVGAGMVVGWLRPWQHAVPVPPPIAAKPRASGPVMAAPAPVPVLREKAGKPELEPALRKSAAAAQAAHPAGGGAARQDAPAQVRPEVAPAPSKVPAGTPAATPDKPGAAERAEAEPEPRVMALSELPASIRQELPNLTISLLSYASNPKDRFAMIDDKLLRQGDLIAPGVRLEQITPDGVVIAYKQYRFHRGVR